MRFIKITLLLLMIAVSVVAQQAEIIKQEAEKIVKATISGDVNSIIKYTHPKVVEAMGGADKMAGVIQTGMAQMKATGAGIIGGEIGEPGKVITVGNHLYALVPQKVIVTSNGTKLQSNSSLLAVSFNKGEKWYFMDIGRMTETQLKYFAPEVVGKIIIPKKTDSQVIE